jgi:hypothetical protein
VGGPLWEARSAGRQDLAGTHNDRGAERPSHKEKETPQQVPVGGPLGGATDQTISR